VTTENRHNTPDNEPRPSGTRRQFIRKAAAAGLVVSAGDTLFLHAAEKRAADSALLDRRSLVRRHNPVVTRMDPFSALSVGNGEFAFTADMTGLQTFTAECDKQFPLCTASHWAWHSNPMPAGLRREDFRYKNYDTHGRPVGYATDAKGQETLFNWLRQNPHRLHLGCIGLALQKGTGAPAKPEDLTAVRQTLDLWTGRLESRFEFEGKSVRLETCCHPELDAIAVRIESQLLLTGAMQVRFAFPYGSPNVNMADWTKPERHSTTIQRSGLERADLVRQVDDDRYHVALSWSAGAELSTRTPHELLLGARSAEALEFVCLFSAKPFAGTLPSAEETRLGTAAGWERFWNEGGAVDLSGSTDIGAGELERRMVLSLYQTAIHCAGSLPSAETGLLCNSWYGKFHLEMHWWHSVHFSAWGRAHLFERSLGLYQHILPLARETARRQGYAGARWPKMLGPDGNDSPSPVGPLLIWQQPHPIYYAELCYRERPVRETLERWRDIVFETAEFMTSYAFRDPSRSLFVLGPPLKTVSENTDPLTSTNPAFELAYWRFGLRTAQSWRARLGLKPDSRWGEVLAGLAPIPTADGLYCMQEGMTDTFTRWNWEHPALLGAFGMQPGDGVDPVTMRRTVRRAMGVWQWERAWGWDFPMAAMAAARVGEPELAVKALLIEVPKNRYWPNGHNYQRENLTAYLPGNGGLLSAIAMMAAGWTGGPAKPAPGFPANGKWRVRAEGLRKWL
jgi:protein-glucosylgalactosylhydroxylysine glucosidase